MKILAFWFGRFLLAVCCLTLVTTGAHSALVEYDLFIETREVNFTGRPVQALTINGLVPGPTLVFSEGDRARIRVHNKLNTETSIHWHGILLPNREDGVPYLTTPPILPGKTHTFEFPLIQSGTYWYHSHTGLQEQRGVYGSLVIHPRGGAEPFDRDYVLVLSDWTDEDPTEVLRMLKRGSGYYALKKGTVPSLAGAWRAGAFQEVLGQWWDRMPPMDISDVGYDRFLINGKVESNLEALPGERVRLRLINAAASTYFYVQSGGGPLTVVAADGPDVEPLEVRRLLMAVAETYDVLLRMPPKPASLEIRATAQDGSGRASVFLGQGSTMAPPDIPKPVLYRWHSQMGHGGPGSPGEAPPIIRIHETERPGAAASGRHSGPDAAGAEKDQPPVVHLAGHGHHAAETTLAVSEPAQERPPAPYAYLRARTRTALDPARPGRRIDLRATGDMERYVWTFNDRTLRESDVILIRKGENVRIDFVNDTMMHHPIHLHGHFFRVLNGQGDQAPLKHTFDLPPLAAQSIEFQADEEKDWLLHCHILYHMEAGMHQIVHYEGSVVDPDLVEYRSRESNHLRHDPWYAWFDFSLLSQMSEGRLTAANTRNTLSLHWENGWETGANEAEVLYSRYVNRFFSAFAGAHFTREETVGVFGFDLLLPLLLRSRVWVTHEGVLRLGLERELQVTDRLSLFGEVRYDTEEIWKGSVGARWRLSRRFFLEARYHSEYGLGAGLFLTY
ncbi:MAG: multicopper oxidase domain-containing protein [Desulfobacterota bacterium]|nr:multicopper oxidase domain-containing protein [Thermodesulfobacteriota bacterium]